MNQLQQKIYDFHKDVQPVLIQILKYYENAHSQNFYENIQRPAKILQERELAECHDSSLDLMVFNVLCNLIGKGGTGCYPELHAHWDHIEQMIKE